MTATTRCLDGRDRACAADIGRYLTWLKQVNARARGRPGMPVSAGPAKRGNWTASKAPKVAPSRVQRDAKSIARTERLAREEKRASVPPLSHRSKGVLF